MRVCRVCLTMSVKMYHMSEHNLSVMYERITGVEINTEDMLPKILCWECVARLSSANNFLVKALKTHWLLMKKLNCSKIITMSDIESIERAQYQLESTLGFKYYKENYSDVYIVEESDKIFDHPCNKDNYNYCDEREVEYCELNNVEEPIIKTEDNITDEEGPIKREYLDANDEQNLADEDYTEAVISGEENKHNFQNLNTQIHVSIKESVSEEEVIDNVSSEASNEENHILEPSELCEEIRRSQEIRQRNWSEELPRCKELRVVLEDVMLFLNKHNTHDSLMRLADNAKSANDYRTVSHPPIRKDILEKKNDYMENITLNTDTTEEKYISVRDPVHTGNKANDMTGTVDSYLSVPENVTKSSKTVFICDTCGKQFQFKTTLIRHIRKHTKMYSCTYCSYKSAGKKNLNRHVNAIHTKTIVYNCSLCSYKAYRRQHLTRHVNYKHTKTNIYNCWFCSYKVYNKSNLSKHINAKHTKTNIYNCSFCNYNAYDKGTLTKHVNAVHTKTTVYNCSHCSYKAYRKNNLTNHVNAKHTKTTVYNCSHCSYKAYKKQHLSKHINAKHTKTNIYNCSFCNYNAYDKGTLTRHVNAKHTKTIVHNCSHCSYKAYRKQHLTRHVNAKHT